MSEPAAMLLRVMSKIRAETPTSCWLWTGSLNRAGYGELGRTDGGTRLAHRIIYDLLVGPIPEGLDIDHTCHNADELCAGGRSCLHRRCVNPEHLEAVTGAENSRRSPSWQGRKTHCVNGHEFTPENTYQRPGARICRACSREFKRQWKLRNPERVEAMRRDVCACGNSKRETSERCKSCWLSSEESREQLANARQSRPTTPDGGSRVVGAVGVEAVAV